MQGYRILIVEDEKQIADIVKAYLENERFKVAVAETGQSALELLKDGVDLIILDLMLPDMPGEDICQAIGKTPKYQSLCSLQRAKRKNG